MNTGISKRVAATVGTTAMVVLSSLSFGTAAAQSSSLALPSCTSTITAPAGAEVPTSGNGTECVLGSGNQGSAVRALQRHLRACNGQSIQVDGIYGPNTRAAVWNVQDAHGISRDGVYGPQTRDAMMWSWGAGNCTNFYSLWT